MFDSSERRPPVTPQLALRVAVLGVLAFALFSIVFFRLWYLQVLSGEEYLQQARDNRVRVERIPAPRGAIVDRSGVPIVENRQATVLTLDPQEIPADVRAGANRWGQLAGRRLMRPKGKRGEPVPYPAVDDPGLAALYARLARVLDTSPRRLHERVVQELAQVPYANVRIKTDVPASVRNYIKERADEFPGVLVEERFLRRYPQRTYAAHLVGTIGEISPQELEQDRFRGVRQGTTIGKGGLERTYDRFLRGRDGAFRIFVNANGDKQGTFRGSDPVPGRQVKLTLDLGLQQSAEAAIRRAGSGKPGAFVAMDPTNGDVLALGSYPSFDPRELARPISQERLDELFGRDGGVSPLFNRAVAGLYPAASTFKPITALAGLDTGSITTGTTVNDAGCIRVGRTAADERCNAGKVANGPVNLRSALEVSSDVFFYQLGLQLNPIDGQPLQKWARALGVGRKSGIDLPDEVPGLVPDRKWRDDINKAEARCRKRQGRPCGIADGTNRPWTVGDEVNLSIGQGDVQVTPLQMAVVYSAIANEGKVPTPHLGKQVEDDQGRLVQEIRRSAVRKVDIDPEWRQAIMDGLKAAASGPRGTSTQVFEDWDHDRFPIYGKTGTAERVGKADQSWYVAYAHVNAPDGRRLKPIVVAVTIEGGGFGAEAAAPAARLMLAKWFNQSNQAKLIRGDSATR